MCYESEESEKEVNVEREREPGVVLNGSRLVERMDMIYVRVLVWFRDKRECPTLFP